MSGSGGMVNVVGTTTTITSGLAIRICFLMLCSFFIGTQLNCSFTLINDNEEKLVDPSSSSSKTTDNNNNNDDDDINYDLAYYESYGYFTKGGAMNFPFEVNRPSLVPPLPL